VKAMSSKLLLLIILLFCVLLSGIAEAKDKIEVIVKEGEAVLGEEMTPAQARVLALNNARRDAIEQVSGAIVHGSSVVYNFQLISDLVASATRGVIVKEEILEDNIRLEGKQIIYHAKIRAYVKILENRERGNLRILKAEVNRYGSPSSTTTIVFQENDEIQIKARVNSDSYIHLFNVSQDGLVTKLYPNEYFKAEMTSPEREFVFPDKKQRDMGFKIRVRTPRNSNRTVETMLIIATKRKIDFLMGKKADEVTLTDLMQEVSEIDSTLWIERVVGYEVRR